jgi:hypothetical protein
VSLHSAPVRLPSPSHLCAAISGRPTHLILPSGVNRPQVLLYERVPVHVQLERADKVFNLRGAPGGQDRKAWRSQLRMYPRMCCEPRVSACDCTFSALLALRKARNKIVGITTAAPICTRHRVHARELLMASASGQARRFSPGGGLTVTATTPGLNSSSALAGVRLTIGSVSAFGRTSACSSSAAHLAERPHSPYATQPAAAADRAARDRALKGTRTHRFARMAEALVCPPTDQNAAAAPGCNTNRASRGVLPGMKLIRSTYAISAALWTGKVSG